MVVLQRCRSNGIGARTYQQRPLRWLTTGIAMLLILVGFVGCGLGSNGKINIRYSLWDPNEMIGYEKSIAAFEKLHPDIHVTIEETPWGQYWQKLNTELAGEDAPDVFWDHPAYFPQLVQEGVLTNISPLIKQYGLDTSIYYPALLKQYQYQGNYYGLPKDWDTIGIFYNKDIFKKMGITVPTDLTWNPTNGGSFLQLAEQLTVDKNGLHPGQPGFNPNTITQYGFLSNNSNQEMYWNYIAMNGGLFLNKPFGDQFTFNQSQSVQSLQFLVNLITKWHVSPSAAETNNVANANIEMFARGQVAMMETGDWNLTMISQQTNFPYGVMELPIGPDGRVSVFNGLSDAIYSKTQHPQQAWQLFQWLASPQSQQIVGSGGYVWPGIKSLDPLYANYWQTKGVDVEPFLQEATGKTTAFPSTPGYNQASIDIGNEFNLMYLGSVSVQQAANIATNQGNADLKSFEEDND
jgi:multiple sugar transport system substrate-binding protein